MYALSFWVHFLRFNNIDNILKKSVAFSKPRLISHKSTK